MKKPISAFYTRINILIFTMGFKKMIYHWYFRFHLFINEVKHLSFLIFTSCLYFFSGEFPFHILLFHFWSWKDLSFRCIQKSYIMNNAKLWLYVYYHMWNRLPIQSRCMRQDAQVHWDDPEGWDRKGQDGEHMYTHGWFNWMYGRKHHNIVK